MATLDHAISQNAGSRRALHSSKHGDEVQFLSHSLFTCKKMENILFCFAFPHSLLLCLPSHQNHTDLWHLCNSFLHGFTFRYTPATSPAHPLKAVDINTACAASLESTAASEAACAHSHPVQRTVFKPSALRDLPKRRIMHLYFFFVCF